MAPRDTTHDNDSVACGVSLGLTHITVARQIPSPLDESADVLHVKLGYNDASFSSTKGAKTFSVGWSNRTLNVHYPVRDIDLNRVVMITTAVPFGPQIQRGDIISMQVDWRRKIISYYRNMAFVGIAVGSETESGAAVVMDWGLVRTPLFFSVSLNTAHRESVCLLPSYPLAPAPRFPHSWNNGYPQPTTSFPSWICSMQRVLQILHSAERRTIPAAVLTKEFIPLCERSMQVLVSLPHAIGLEQNVTVTRDIHVPHADAYSIAFMRSNALTSNERMKITVTTMLSTIPQDGCKWSIQENARSHTNKFQGENILFYEQVGSCVRIDHTLLSPLLPNLVAQLKQRFWHPACAAAVTIGHYDSVSDFVVGAKTNTSSASTRHTIVQCHACCGRYPSANIEGDARCVNSLMEKGERCPCEGKHSGSDCHGAEECALECRIPGWHKPGTLVANTTTTKHHACILEREDFRRRRGMSCDVCGDSLYPCSYCCKKCDFHLCDNCDEGGRIPAKVPFDSHGSCAQGSSDISDPPVGNCSIVALDMSCLSAKSEDSLHHLLNYSSYLSSYWEANNSNQNNEVTVQLTATEIEALGKMYRIEFFTTNYGNSYDPDEITVSGGEDQYDIREVSFVSLGTSAQQRCWVTIAYSDQFEDALGGEKVIPPIVVVKFSSKKSGGCKFKAAGLRFVSERNLSPSQFCSDLCAKHGSSNITADAIALIAGVISEGDQVMRGPDWRWGDEDGGVGSFGRVLIVKSWRGQVGKGVVVKWKNTTDFDGLYRWGFQGLYDLVVIRRRNDEADNFSNPVLMLPAGQCVRITICPEVSTLTSECVRKKSEAIVAMPTIEKEDNWNENKGAEIKDDTDISCLWKGSPLFNGKTSLISLPCNDLMEFTGDFTIETWVRIPSSLSKEKKHLPILSRKLASDGGSIDQLWLAVTVEQGPGDGDEISMQSESCRNGHAINITPG